jgi:hypothetical protein
MLEQVLALLHLIASGCVKLAVGRFWDLYQANAAIARLDELKDEYKLGASLIVTEITLLASIMTFVIHFRTAKINPPS